MATVLGMALLPAGSAAQPGSSAAQPETSAAQAALRVTYFDVAAGAHPHDVAPAADGGVWYTGQRDGTLGHLDPASGEVTTIALGRGSAPHGVIVGPDGAPWITDGGQDAIVRVDPGTSEVSVHSLPFERAGANLNTATFDADGNLWFTGQAGIYGRLDPRSGSVDVFEAPGGRGPYGITTCPNGDVWYASLAGSHIARIDRDSGEADVVTPPTPEQGARRVWCDSMDRVWVAEWNAGQVGRYDTVSETWQEWPLPGASPQAYAVYVDDEDVVWLTDFGSNSLVRFDPASETFTAIPLADPDAAVRQLLGRPGEVWGAESAVDRLVLVYSG